MSRRRISGEGRVIVMKADCSANSGDPDMFSSLYTDMVWIAEYGELEGVCARESSVLTKRKVRTDDG